MPSLACTTYAVLGDQVEEGGVLIAKNRDNPPQGYEAIRYHQAENVDEIAYVALNYSETDGPNKKVLPYISAGINQAGLNVVHNAASSYAMNDNLLREEMESAAIVNILKHYHNVQEVIAHQKAIFTLKVPLMLMIADTNHILLAEVAPDGHYVLTQKTKASHEGTSNYLYHTNHFTEESLLQYNTKAATISSLKRYERVAKLLKQQTSTFTMNDMLRIANDRSSGMNESIYRGVTLATWISHLFNDHSILYVRFTSPKQHYHEYVLNLDANFWNSPHFQSCKQCAF